MRRTLMLAIPAILPVMGLAAAAMAPANQPVIFEDSRMIIEFNATDQDVGVQVFLDGEPWKYLKIVDPHGRAILEVNGRSTVKDLGLTEFFFESNEPPLNELSLADFKARFPEGWYQFYGKAIDGTPMRGRAMFTHAIPDGPDIVSPQDGAVAIASNTVVAWNPTADPPGSHIVEYEIIVEQVSPKRVFDVHVPASVHHLAVPAEFMAAGASYKLEVLAIEAGGNQTITATEFSTASAIAGKFASPH